MDKNKHNIVTRTLIATANWFTAILGMNDKSRYGIFIRRIVGGSFAGIMLFLFFDLLHSVCFQVYYHMVIIQKEYANKENFNQQFISRNVTYYAKLDGTPGYLETRDGKKMVKGIRWIAPPLGLDSLVCYSDGRRRGYFNKYTGEVAISPKYQHAWVFSEGLAAVEDKGTIKFIDTKGRIAFDTGMPFSDRSPGYVFHGKYCVIDNNDRSHVGLMDKQGKWILKPEFFHIYQEDSLIVTDDGKMMAVYTDNMKPVLPPMEAQLYVDGDVINAIMPDHTLKLYTLDGNVKKESEISNTFLLTYRDSKDNKEHIARCIQYEGANGWYGLLSPDGKRLTPPTYKDITAFGHDIYLCKDEHGLGTVIDGNGKHVK